MFQQIIYFQLDGGNHSLFIPLSNHMNQTKKKRKVTKARDFPKMQSVSIKY